MRVAEEDPRLRAYRRMLRVFMLVAGCIAVVVGTRLLARGRIFHAFLALCVVGFLVLVSRGYAAEER